MHTNIPFVEHCAKHKWIAYKAFEPATMQAMIPPTRRESAKRIIFGWFFTQLAVANSVTQKEKTALRNDFKQKCHHQMTRNGDHFDCTVEPGCCEKLRLPHVRSFFFFFSLFKNKNFQAIQFYYLLLSLARNWNFELSQKWESFPARI